MLFCKDFFQRQAFLNKNRPHLSKSNPFIFKIDSILRVFPDAKFVFLVRDPLETLPSYFSLQENVKFGNLLSDKEIKNEVKDNKTIVSASKIKPNGKEASIPNATMHIGIPM